MKILMDVNAIADSYLHRQPFHQDSDAIIRANDRGLVDIYLAAFTVPTLFYILERDLSPKIGSARAAAEALADIRACLASFLICPIDYGDLFQALSLPGRDYEDNLQITCVLNSHLDAIVTRDKKLRSNLITVLDPAQLRKQLGI